MFSGIIEAQSELLTLEKTPPSAKLTLQKPPNWNDVQTGDSIAVNGVCLTVEALTESTLQFTLGPETLKITHWTEFLQPGQGMNLERSLAVGDRMHGHFVPGHVDEMGRLESRNELGDCLELWISCSAPFQKFLWKKASVSVNGVSLTVNDLEPGRFQVVLIPETLRITNLAHLQVGDLLCLEADFFARGLIQVLESREAQI